MSRPSIPKLSLAFKKPGGVEERPAHKSAPMSAVPDYLAIKGGSLSSSHAAMSMPRLVLPSSSRHEQAPNGDSPTPPQLNGKQEHAVYVLVPGLAFPGAAAGESPLTVGDLKARCRDALCPPSSSSAPSNAPPPQLEFFRLSALVRLTDDTIPAPPGLVVAGAHLHHQDLTLGLVERVMEENRGLRERVELAGEALLTLEERVERDAQTIRLLRESLATLTAEHRALKDHHHHHQHQQQQHNHHALLSPPASSIISSSSCSPSSSSSSPSSPSSSSSSALSLPASASGTVSPRTTSPRSSADRTSTAASAAGGLQAPHPHTLSHTPRAFHNSFPSLISPRSPSRPSTAGTSANLNATNLPFSPREAQQLVSPATSPRRRLACRTGNCTCNAFTPQPSASWICVCGHMSLKHAGPT